VFRSFEIKKKKNDNEVSFEMEKKFSDQRALVCASELCDRLVKSSPPHRGIKTARRVALRFAANQARPRDGAAFSWSPGNRNDNEVGFYNEIGFFLFFFFDLKAPKHTLPPQTPTRTALAHSTRTKSTDPVYGSVSL